MNNIFLREYQQRTVDNIAGQANNLLDNFTGLNFKKILFRSPTGSGKTVMMSAVIEKLVSESLASLSFVWISKGVLVEQSKYSVEEKIGGGSLITSFLEDVLDNCIKQNEILFINWEQIFSKAGKDNLEKGIKKGDPINRFMKDNEEDKNLNIFCRNARDEGRKIVLIVDESHLNITENTIRIVEEIIKPALQIDMTATPKMGGGYSYGDRDGEYVELQTVKDAEVIKKEVVINADITREALKSEQGGDEIILSEAIKKRKHLEGEYNKELSNVKPLVLIQLPNEGEKMSELDKQKRDWVEPFLKDKGISYENKKLARWLTGDDKENLENITRPDSEVEFLIFKQVVAVGWDCPRAHILVKFRQTSSEIFEIQTVGRIMRMPEFKHYESEHLNRAYLYANLQEIKIDENALEYFKIKKALRIKEYKDINLVSSYLMRGEYNDLMLDYRKYFFEEFIDKIGGELDEGMAKKNIDLLKKYKNTDGSKFNFNVKRPEESIIVDELVDSIDTMSRGIRAKGENKARLDDHEISRKFIAFLKKNCGEFQQARSYDKIRVSIYHLFEKYLGLNDRNEDKIYLQKLVLGNTGFFQSVIENSINKYAKYRGRLEKKYKTFETWNIPAEDFYQKDTVEKDYKKCVMDPVYILPKWQTEISFIETYLEKSKEIIWWFKNGDSKNEIYFGIPFVDELGKQSTFYPDFIVMYKDGRIGIFDTKAGQTAYSMDTRLKAKALKEYISKNEQNNLFGEIVIPDREYQNWKIFSDDTFDMDKMTNLT